MIMIRRKKPKTPKTFIKDIFLQQIFLIDIVEQLQQLPDRKPVL